jgi:hypothetical protein
LVRRLTKCKKCKILYRYDSSSLTFHPLDI